MSEHPQLSLHQIVWATVHQFPAWPAKIVRKLHQHGKTVYKVNFFGDPTYCYLHSHSLTPFSQFEIEQFEQSEQNFKLRRAIELAKFSLYKQIDKICCTNTQQSHVLTEAHHLPVPLEQTQICSKEDIGLPQKKDENKTIVPNQNSLSCFSLTQITAQNVMEALEAYEKEKNGQVLENLKRKQIICFQNDLKQKLLFKYKLNAVNQLRQTSRFSQCLSTVLKDKRSIKRQKKKNQTCRFEGKQLYLRKMQKILIRKGVNRHLASNVALKIVDHLQKISEGPASIKNQNCKQNMMRTIYQISCHIQQIQQIELEYLQKQVLSLIDIEFHHNKTQEGSRITEMYEQFIS